MYLSLLHLNPSSFEVRRDVRDVRQLHITVMKAFPELSTPARTHFDLLHRLEYNRTVGWQLYVQSNVAPDWSVLPNDYLMPVDDNPGVKSVSEAYTSIQEGSSFRFRIRANPTRKVDTKTGPDGLKRNGKRVPVRGADEQIQWLLRQSERSGFALQQVTIAATGSTELLRSYDKRLTFQGVVYEGTLVVVNREDFKKTLEKGIGPGKAFGFGLLSLAPN